MRRTFSLHIRASALVAAALVLAACSSKPPPPGSVEMSLHAADNLNPGPGGQSAPVVVRVYELAGSGAFTGSDFFQLFDKEGPTLGADLKQRQEVTLVPGETRTLTLPLKDGVQRIGVAAAFRDIDHAQWRATVDVPPNGTTKLDVKLSGVSVALAKLGS